MLHSRQKCYDHLQKNRPDFIFSPRDSIAPLPPPPPSLSLSKQRSFAKSEPNLLRRTASFHEDAVMCSLSIAPSQTCARGRGRHHFELWPVGRPGAAEEEGREGWRWMTRTVEERGGGGGGGLDLSLFFHALPSFAKPIHTHTHTHTHTHFSFLFLVIIRTHTYTVTIVFSPFFGGGGDFTIICFIYSFVYQFTCLFICSFVHLFVYLLIYSFVCLFTWKMSFLPPGILHRFICLHNYVKKKAFFFYYSWLFLVAHLLSMISEEITAFITSYTVHEQCNCKPI